MNRPNYRLRPLVVEDHEFLWSLNEESYRAYIERLWGWDEEWQRAEFRTRMGRDDLSKRVVELEGVSVGYIELDESEASIHVDNFQIAMAHRSRGLGGALMREVMTDAGSRGKAVELHVFHINRGATAFYRSLGFLEVGTTETHVRMRWSHESFGRENRKVME